MNDATDGVGTPQPQLTIVVPSYNERDNVEPVVARISAALRGIPFEILFVDDFSPDGTANRIRKLAQTNPRCRLITRCGPRGLSGAALQGMLSAQAPIVALMDADLQHDEALLAPMKAVLDAGRADIVIASRYAGGGESALDGYRHALSVLGGLLVRNLLGVRVSDPLSGFFMARRTLIEGVAARISPEGFKILVDILTIAPRGTNVAEIPSEFRSRQHGVSKLDAKIAFEFAALLASKLTRGTVPLRFIMFCFVGGIGILVHLAAAWAILQTGQAFVVAQTCATLVAMTSNFFLNNSITHRDRHLRGMRLVAGLAAFYGICSFGVVANVGLASLFFNLQPTWWLAALAGAVVGTVWNYAISATFVWRSR